MFVESSISPVLLFIMYEFLRCKGKVWLSVLAVAAVMTVVTSVSSRAVEEPSQLALWFMEPSRFTRVYYGNTFALVMFFGFILISCLVSMTAAEISR